MLALCVFVLGGVSGTGYAAKGDFSQDKPVKRADIALGKAKVVNLGTSVADLMLADPSIAEVSMLKANNAYVVGKSVGSTNLIALNDRGDVVRRVNIHVGLNLDQLRNKIASMYPDADVDISALGQQVVIDGIVENGDRAARISRVVASYVGERLDSEGSVDEIVENMLEVRSGQQVTLRVRIIEARRNALHELGVGPSLNDSIENPPGNVTQFFEKFEPRAQDFSDFGSFTRSNPGTSLSNTPFANARILKDTAQSGIGLVELAIQALESRGLASTLAEPNLTSISGEEAGFQVGGQVPIPSGRDESGNIEIELQDVGVNLDFKPEVITPERINLQLETQVREVNPANGINQGGLNVPGFNTRRAATTVELNSGESMMIAGLIESESLENISGLPGLSRSPVLRKLAGSESFQRNESEVVIIVTPYLSDGYENDRRVEKTGNIQQQQTHPLPLQEAFKRNISARYGDDATEEMTKGQESYGYILN